MNRYFKYNINDDWETPIEYLELLIPLLDKEITIYDPFYFNGKVKQKWETLGYKCIHNNEDFYKINKPNEFVNIVSNPPYHNKNEMLKRLFEWDLPFILLMPISTISYIKTQKILKDKNIQIIIPNIFKGFINMYGIQTKCTPFYLCFICYKICLEKDITFL